MDDGGQMTVDGRRWTDDGGRTTVDGRRWTDDGGRTTVDGRRWGVKKRLFPNGNKRFLFAAITNVKPTSVCRPPFAVIRPPSSVCRPPSTVVRPPSAVHRRPSTVVRPNELHFKNTIWNTCIGFNFRYNTFQWRWKNTT
jgi:hypothetical protein